ncbi:unnamed protein product [Auanema sp. JU1783]|nr:unnamed protein product [Auanema sp. JU1783]
MERLWKITRKDETQIEYSALALTPDCTMNHEEILCKYLQTNVDLEKLCIDWSEADSHVSKLLEAHDDLKGIRILDQNPLETLFAFICSANNNIKRISKMVNRLCILYGSKLELQAGISEEDSKIVGGNEGIMYAFPTIQQMAVHLPTMENQLRQDGFGYRAAYIAKTVKMLADAKDDYLHSLRSQDLKKAKEALREFSGVGPKKHNVVPVDTHVYKTTLRDYQPTLSAKSLTPTVHDEIGSFYIEKFGEYAGWAQALLFNAQLSQKRPNSSKQNESLKKKKKKN